MRHAVLSPTRRLAERLTDAIIAEGWHARIITNRRHVGVIIHAPTAVVNIACRRVGFEPGRTLGA
jgi:hypothetical protein